MVFVLPPALVSASRSCSQMLSWVSKPAPSPLLFLPLLTTWHRRKLTSPHIVLLSLAASD